MGEMRYVHKILVGKTEGKRQLRGPRRRLVGNIRMDLREIIWEVLGWINLAQDRDQCWALVNMIMNLWIS
jgi:hypothetical protein